MHLTLVPLHDKHLSTIKLSNIWNKPDSTILTNIHHVKTQYQLIYNMLFFVLINK